MRRGVDGVWSVVGMPQWKGASYLYEVDVYVPATGVVETNLVTDPYSLALTTNSQRSVVVDLDDPALRPTGWDDLAKPALASRRTRPSTSSTFATSRSATRPCRPPNGDLPRLHRRPAATGCSTCARWPSAGLNTLHLLPVFDIATIPERRADQAEPGLRPAVVRPPVATNSRRASSRSARPTASTGATTRGTTRPEGSYATDPEGPAAPASSARWSPPSTAPGCGSSWTSSTTTRPRTGRTAKSVLDRIVPGYYHRLSSTGTVETSTCCSNTATEHAMMEKLMVDSVVTWARDYKVDGFRFDLMGHHSRANMEAVRAALDELTVADDGVDGVAIYVYGEGWNFGEVAEHARFQQARQLELFGSGIGTFTDRLRDAVRGGGPFDANPRIQGFASGLYTDPNGDPVNGTPQEQLARLLLTTTRSRSGSPATCATTSSSTAPGRRDRRRRRLQRPAGRLCRRPQRDDHLRRRPRQRDAVRRDPVQAAPPTSMADRVRMNTVALSTTALAQGPSFWHAGADLLRSKSLDRNSYNSGDWFNRVDWTPPDSPSAPGCRRARTTSRSGASCSRCSPTRR